MQYLQHNVVSILYAVKGQIESHFGREEDHLFQDGTAALQHAREILKNIYDQADRAMHITKRISQSMEVPKPGSEPHEYVSVKEVWEDVITQFRAKSFRSSFEIINRIPDDFPKIKCVRHDLVEIFYCLAENAIQAMRDSSASANRLIIRANLGYRTGEEPIANITIADTGSGIPEETLNKLFEPFMTTKEPEEGNGLGLCLVKSLVRKNGGSISVSSFKGCGTTFTLSFTVARPSEREQSEPLNLAG